MTYRVYVRWPDQRVSNKTSTDNRDAAQLAMNDLRERAEQLRAEGALGLTLTQDGRQLEYVELNAEEGRGPQHRPGRSKSR